MKLTTLTAMFAILSLCFALISCDDGTDSSAPPGTGQDSQVSPDNGIGPGTDTGTVQPQAVNISIASMPAGAIIWKDGEQTDLTTPETIQVTPNCYVLGLTMEGYADWEEYICVEGDMDLGEVELAEAVDPLEDYRCQEGTWERLDNYPDGPEEAVLTFDIMEVDGAELLVIKGLHPVPVLPFERISDTQIEVNWTSGDGLTNVQSLIEICDTEILLSQKYNGSDIEKVYVYHMRM